MNSLEKIRSPGGPKAQTIYRSHYNLLVKLLRNKKIIEEIFVCFVKYYKKSKNEMYLELGKILKRNKNPNGSLRVAILDWYLKFLNIQGEE